MVLINTVDTTHSLVEPHVRQFANYTLKQYHINRVNMRNLYINIASFVILGIIIAAALWYGYKNRPTEADILLRKVMHEQYILSEINKYNEDKRKSEDRLLTGLPHFTREF